MTTVATYASVHSRLFRERGRAAEHPCSSCGHPAAQWSYDGTDPDEKVGRADVRGGVAPYSADLAHYKPLCTSCHRAIDGHANRDKTHCPQGHEYTDQNTYVWRGARHCRACKAARRRAAEERN